MTSSGEHPRVGAGWGQAARRRRPWRRHPRRQTPMAHREQEEYIVLRLSFEGRNVVGVRSFLKDMQFI